MIFVYSIIAIFIAWIWVDYYRMINIYDRDNLKYFILTFFLGCTSVLFVYLIHPLVLDHFYFELNGDFLNDFLFCVFKIGMVEEIAKAIPFVIMYFAFNKQFNEPIDYLAFFSVSALGFSAAENVLYFNDSGPGIIGGRAILATVGHMFDSALVAYGIIRFKYTDKKNKVLGIFVFFFLAAISHGYYDFWLIHEGTKAGGIIITVLYFMVTISVFAVILNNALNNSTFFTYKKVIDSDKVLNRLLTHYAIVLGIQFILMLFYVTIEEAIAVLIYSVLFSGFIIIVTSIRLSRFKLIHKRWNALKLEFPFTMRENEATGSTNRILNIVMRGDSINEMHINAFYEEYIILNPVSQRNTHLGTPRLAYIYRKIFLYRDETFYVVKVFDGNEHSPHQLMLIKAKVSSVTMVNKKYPIVALLKIENLLDLENTKLSATDFKFKEWAFIKPT